MDDNDLLAFIKIYNDSENKPSTALEWLLFIHSNGFIIYKRRDQ